MTTAIFLKIGLKEGDNVHCDPTFEACCSLSEPHLLTQGDLTDLLRDLSLSQIQAEFLCYRQVWDLLHLLLTHYREQSPT